MQDKASVVSYGWSLATFTLGAMTWQEWAALAGIVGVVVTTAAKVWESRKKIEIREKEASAAKKASEEEQGYWKHRRRTDPVAEHDDDTKPPDPPR